MSQAKHAYRNVVNGRIGELTEDQARVFPDLLERVDAEPVAEEPAQVVPLVTVAPTEAASPARITKKKD